MLDPTMQKLKPILKKFKCSLKLEEAHILLEANSSQILIKSNYFKRLKALTCPKRAFCLGETSNCGR